MKVTLVVTGATPWPDGYASAGTGAGTRTRTSADGGGGGGTVATVIVTLSRV